MASDDLLVIENGALLLAQITAKVEAATAEVMAEINATTEEIKAEAKAHCPVLTGALQADIDDELATDPMAIETSVFTTLDYSKYVENGTHKMSAQPFLLPAFVIKTAHLEERLAAAINAALQQ